MVVVNSVHSTIMSGALDAFVSYLQETALLTAIQSQLSWDQETNLPRGAIETRCKQQAYLAARIHERRTSDDYVKLLAGCVDLETGACLDPTWRPEQQCIVKESYRDWQKQRRVPTAFMERYRALTAKATHVWSTARQEKNYGLFEPYLADIVEANKQLAQYTHPHCLPYDALLDAYEPQLTTDKVTALFTSLKDAIVPLLAVVRRAQQTTPDKPLKGPFDSDAQWQLSIEILKRMGFCFQRGRQDRSAHPFTIASHPTDVRLTTRLTEASFFESLSSSVHEGGHGLYEQGLAVAFAGTPMGEAVSLGIHESQSRYWENHVCKSLPFWQGQFDRLCQAFPQLQKTTPERLYAAVNAVTPSAIRVEADELSYSLHVIIRFECEQALLTGEVSTQTLPEYWTMLYQRYLGITPKNDAEGVLQDIHWAGGDFGYFPTYVIGSVYAAVFDATLREMFPDFDQRIGSGEWGFLTAWFAKQVHCHGRLYAPEELMKRCTGKGLDTAIFITYLKQKYSTLYPDVT